MAGGQTQLPASSKGLRPADKTLAKWGASCHVRLRFLGHALEGCTSRRRLWTPWRAPDDAVVAGHAHPGRVAAQRFVLHAGPDHREEHSSGCDPCRRRMGTTHRTCRMDAQSRAGDTAVLALTSSRKRVCWPAREPDLSHDHPIAPLGLPPGSLRRQPPAATDLEFGLPRAPTPGVSGSAAKPLWLGRYCGM